MAEPVIDPIVEPVVEPVVEPDADTWTPPTREEYEAVLAEHVTRESALKAANAESAKRRIRIKELEQATEDADQRANRIAAEAALDKYKPLAVSALAKAAFLEAGAQSSKVARLSKLLDSSAVEIDGDNVSGLDDQIASIKTDFPELFQPTGTSPVVVPRVDASGKQPVVDPSPKDAGTLIMNQLLGRN